MTRFTVDELAREAGIPTSTIRLYRQRALLPAPMMEGRVGFFDESHVARLALIAELRGRGYSLAGIKELVDTWTSGRDLASVLGVGVATPSDETVVCTRAEIAERVPALADDELMERFLHLDIARRRDDGGYDVPTRFLAVVNALSGIGLPIEVMFDEFAKVDDFARAAATRFVALFEEHVLADAVQLDPSAAASVIAVLRTTAIEIVDGVLGRAIDEAAHAALARYGV